MLAGSAVDAAAKPKRKRSTTVRKPTARSRVGNGKALLAGIDQRSSIYREFQDCVADMVAHLGNDATVTEQAMIEEAAGLVVWCRTERLKLLTGGAFQIGPYTTAVNSLRRLLVDLGLEQRLTDVTDTIEAAVARHRAERARKDAQDV
jgi:hypothetical protein